MTISKFCRNPSLLAQLNLSWLFGQRGCAQFTLSAVFAGLSLAAFDAHCAEEPKPNAQPTPEATTVVAPEKAVPEKRSSSSPTVLKEASTPSKIIRYSHCLLNLYDTNHDGVLQGSEWAKMHGKPELMDTNGDGDITVEEITRWVAGYGRRKQSGNFTSPEPATPDAIPTTKPTPSNSSETEASPQSAAAPNGDRHADRSKETKYYVSPKRLPAGLPEWFVQRDLDGDGQLTFTEYSPNNVAAELIEFESYDANGDGVVTAKECVTKNSDKAASKDNGDSRSNSNGQSVTKQARGKRKTKDTP